MEIQIITQAFTVDEGLKQTLQYGNTLACISECKLEPSLKQTLQYGNSIVYYCHNSLYVCLKQTLQYGNTHSLKKRVNVFAV